MSKPEDTWIIYYGRVKTFLGRMVPHTPEDNVPPYTVELSPCFELVDMKLPGRDGSITNMVSVQPLAGFLHVILVRLDTRDPCPTIMLDELSEADRRYMMQQIKDCLDHLTELRAARSGIVLPEGTKTQ